MPKRYSYGLSITILAALLFSIKAVFIKIAYQYGASVAMVMTLRVLFSLPAYLWMFYSLTRSNPHSHSITLHEIIAIAALGVCGYYCAAYLDLTGLQYISANLERLIIYLYPTFVVFLSAIFFKRNISLVTLACILLSYGGVTMVFLQDFSLARTGPTDTDKISLAGINIPPLMWGTMITVLSALCFSIYIAFSQNLIKRVGSAYFTVLAMSFASIAILLHAQFELTLSSLLNQHFMVYTMSACAAIISTVLPSFLLAEGIKQIGANDASMASAIGPFGTLVVGSIFLGEAITYYHLIGLLLVILGIVLMARHQNTTT